MQPLLSVVVPLYNEAEVVVELVERCVQAAAHTELPFEVIVVNDGSTDSTAANLAACAGDPRVVVVEPGFNQGQFRATKAGLSVARGDVVCVLDGDLQDPPEVLGTLVTAHHADPNLGLIFAIKAARDDPMWFRIGRAGYRLMSLIAGGAPPSGAGSYCLMSRELAQRVGSVMYTHANLAPVLWSQRPHGLGVGTVEYTKKARYDGRSRVGAIGLIREALGSLAVTGALGRLGWLSLGLLTVTLLVRLWWI